MWLFSHVMELRADVEMTYSENTGTKYLRETFRQNMSNMETRLLAKTAMNKTINIAYTKLKTKYETDQLVDSSYAKFKAKLITGVTLHAYQTFPLLS